jgi:hypothetical protein
MKELESRTGILIDQAVGLLGKVIFSHPLLHSNEYATSHSIGRGLQFQRSIHKRSLISDAAKMWDEEKRYKSGTSKYPNYSIPSVQYFLRGKDLPEPHKYCFDGRSLCLEDLREKEKERYDSIRLIRDKSIGHPEIEEVDVNKFRLFDLSECFLSNDDLQEFILRSIEIVDSLNHVIRGAGMTWNDTAQTFKKHAIKYYGVTDFTLEYEPLKIKV